MFSSPAIQIYSSENAESHVQRKPGSQVISRKALMDRSVNGETPLNQKLMKKVSNIKTNIKPAQHEIIETNINPVKQEIIETNINPAQHEALQDDDLDVEDFIFSGKDIDDAYDTVWPHPVLGKEGILNIIRNHSYPKDTPPPSPSFDVDEYKPEFFEIYSDFLKLPEFNWEPEKPILYDEIEVDVPDLKLYDD